MGGICSLEDPDDAHHHHHHDSVDNPKRQLEPEAVKPINALTAEQSIQLNRLWNSVVVGELVKNHALSIADHTMPVLSCVQQMIKQGSNYCIVRKIEQVADKTVTEKVLTQTSELIHSNNLTSPSAIAMRKRQKETYVGLFDWRDLTALLVMVCKQARLHGANGAIPAAPTIKPPVPIPTVTTVDESRKIGEKNPLIVAQPTRGARVAPSDQISAPSPTGNPKFNTAASPSVKNSAAANQPKSGSLTPGSAAAANPPSPSKKSTSPQNAAVSALDEYLHFLDMKRAPTGMVANLSGRNPMQIVNQVCPLLGGVKVLVAANDQTAPMPTTRKKNPWSNRHTDSGDLTAVSKQELYRLTIVDKNGLYIGCLTQLAICHWIDSKLQLLTANTSLAEQSLHDLGLGQRRVMTIGWKAPVLSAITLMHEKSLSALAIINDTNGKLVGTISCSDVKYLFMAPDLLLTLERPVSVFISMLRQSTSYWHVNLASNPPPTASSASVTVTPRTSLADTIKKLLATKVRRAWVVNDSEQPIGYISITDIIKFFLQQTGGKK